MQIKRLVSALICASLTLSAAVSCVPTAYTGDLVINEIMAKNTSFLTDASGTCPDWVELYNPGGTDVSLNDWFISDEELDPAKYQLPDIVLKAGEYRVIFCDGEDRYDPDTDEIHTNFSISSSGEKIFLLSKSGKRAELEFSESLADISYGRVEDGTAADTSYMWFASPTPGAKNGGKFSSVAADVVAKAETALLITEFSSSNSETLPSKNGACYGYVTVKNITDERVSLSGYCLSDKESKAEKWHFPSDMSLDAGQSITLWCSGLDTADGGEIHTNFKLNSNDSELILSLAGAVSQKIPLQQFPEGIGVKVNEADSSLSYKRLGSEELFETYEEAAKIESIGVCINEVSAVKGNGAKEAYDWVELYNATDKDIDISGWSLSDSGEERARLTFEDTVIKAKEYLLVYCAGENPETVKKSSVYAPFKLDTAGETLYLTKADGVTADVFTTGKLRSAVTSGRGTEGDGARVFFSTPTPGEQNDGKTYSGYAFNPVLSHSGGYVEKGTEIEIASSQTDTVYRYTLDGSLPTSASPEFRGITVNKNTVLRVKAFKDGKLSSDTVTVTYLLSSENVSGLPYVCLASDPDGLFSDEEGIFALGYSYSSSFPYSGANFWQDWERETNFEYYVNGENVINALAGIKIFGQYSRAYDQKSMAVYFRSDYGTGSVTYPFFEDSDHTTLTSLVLRAGGQDQNMTRIRDAYCSQLMKGNTSLVFQEWQPISVYINGEYWGFFGLREKINDEWLSMYAGVDGDNVDLIKGNRTAKSGTNEAWMELRDYVKSHDLSKDEYYDYVCSQVDIDNFIDYLITEIFFCNGDTGNVKFYRERSEEGKWRWIMYDFDMTLRSESLWNSYNAFEELFDPDGHGSNNGFYTHLQCGLLENEEFREKFSARFAELLNTVFMPENMKAELDRMISLVDGEMDRHCERWGKPETYEDWLNEVDALYNIISKRRDHVKKQLVEFMDLSSSEVERLFPNG